MNFKLKLLSVILIVSLSADAQQSLTPSSVSVSGPVTANSVSAAGLGSSATPVCTTTGGLLTNSGCSTTLSNPSGTATFTAGTGITSVACTSGYTCTNTRGDITITSLTSVAGTIATVNFSSALSTAPGLCTVTQNGGAVSFGIGHGAASTTSFAITAGVNVGATTVSVDYTCAP